MTDKPPRIYTVTLDRCDSEHMPWVSSFSLREKANEFIRKARAKLESYGVSDVFQITLDSSELDDEQYLDWIDDDFGEEETNDDE